MKKGLKMQCTEGIIRSRKLKKDRQWPKEKGQQGKLWSTTFYTESWILSNTHPLKKGKKSGVPVHLLAPQKFAKTSWLREHLSSPPVFNGVCVAHPFSKLCVVLCFLVLFVIGVCVVFPILPVFLYCHTLLPLRFSLTFIHKLKANYSNYLSFTLLLHGTIIDRHNGNNSLKKHHINHIILESKPKCASGLLLFYVFTNVIVNII